MAAPSVDLPASFERHLRAESKSTRTVQSYLEAVPSTRRLPNKTGKAIYLTCVPAPAIHTRTWSGSGSAARGG
jgi:hypothetical protein